MKTRQQQRDEELQQTLTPLFPPVLAEIVTGYAGAELSLSPLERNEYGNPTSNPSNEPIAKEIVDQFAQHYPGSTLFQDEITETHHIATLHGLFSMKEAAETNRDVLKATMFNDGAALAQRRRDVSAVVNFLPQAQCDQLLEREMAPPIKQAQDREELGRLQQVNCHFLMEAMQKKHHGPETERIRQRELEFKRAKLMVQVAAGTVNVNLPEACKVLLQALQIFCNINKKREMIDVAIQLIEHSNAFQGHGEGDFDGMLSLFFTTKKLCLSYPADNDLYAKLLFAMDEPCKRHFALPLLKELYHEAHSGGILLLHGYQAKFDLRHIIVDHRTGADTISCMRRVSAALDFCTSFATKSNVRPFYNDMSRGEFICSYAKLFRLAAKLTEILSQRCSQWNDQQWDDVAEMLSAMEQSVRLHGHVENLYPGLTQDDIETSIPASKRFLTISAGYYKCALNVLNLPGVGRGKTTQLIVPLFNDLVGFYQRQNSVYALEALLQKKTVTSFMKLEDFKTRLPEWRAVLKAMRKAL